MSAEIEKHLEFIQAVITRMANNSFAIKGWSITLVSAILVVTYQLSDWRYAFLALLPTLVFWGLDGYYLHQERLFRKLYDDVRMRDKYENNEDRYSMNTKPFTCSVQSWLRICFSATIGWLYGPVAIVILILSYLAYCGGLQK